MKRALSEPLEYVVYLATEVFLFPQDVHKHLLRLLFNGSRGFTMEPSFDGVRSMVTSSPFRKKLTMTLIYGPTA